MKKINNPIGYKPEYKKSSQALLTFNRKYNSSEKSSFIFDEHNLSPNSFKQL